MTKHSPGPWRTGDMFNTVFGPKTDAPSPVTIATVSKGNQANARLIAASPDMLAACKAALAWFHDGEGRSSGPIGDMLRAAIAKAED
jgi:hypothetical protein